jgi:uncharacterized Zn ribbon protein
VDKKAKAAALAKMAKEDSYKEIPPHEVKCPNCGHEWTMGEEEEYEEDDES